MAPPQPWQHPISTVPILMTTMLAGLQHPAGGTASPQILPGPFPTARAVPAPSRLHQGLSSPRCIFGCCLVASPPCFCQHCSPRAGEPCCEQDASPPLTVSASPACTDTHACHATQMHTNTHAWLCSHIFVRAHAHRHAHTGTHTRACTHYHTHAGTRCFKTMLFKPNSNSRSDFPRSEQSVCPHLH